MQSPDLTVFHVSHHAIRTDAARLATAVAAVTEPQRASRGRSLSRWFGGYLDELHDHHSVEDELYFPALLARVPSFDRHLGRIEAEHSRLDELLDRSRVAIAWLGDADTAWPEASAEATEATRQLRALLDAHLGFEDTDVVPLYARHFGAEEYEEVEDRAKKYVALGHLPFMIPWILDAATEDEQRRMLGGAPLAFKLVWYATRRRYRRMAGDAFGPALTAGALA